MTYEIVVEQLAQKFHEIRKRELVRQECAEEIYNYSQMPNHMQEYNRVVARFVIAYCGDDALRRMLNATME
jgi:hypothetical protein